MILENSEAQQHAVEFENVFLRLCVTTDKSNYFKFKGSSQVMPVSYPPLWWFSGSYRLSSLQGPLWRGLV